MSSPVVSVSIAGLETSSHWKPTRWCIRPFPGEAEVNDGSQLREYSIADRQAYHRIPDGAKYVTLHSTTEQLSDSHSRSIHTPR